ncbi:MAG: S46 family peptidase, partial [Bacteroidales bacterium]
MRKWLITYLIGVLLFPGIQADEGMWLVPLIKDLNMDRMQEMGLELEAEDIYSLDNPSLKDVIGALDYGGCTAEIISSEGLIITNHHCGEDEIQFHSSTEHDYLTNGFWAMSREEELPNPGKTISFVIRMENVTEKILGMVHLEMTEAEREAEIDKSSETLIGEAVEGTHYEAVVIPLYEGDEYSLVVMETFKDVRLVGAPPESIGRFGGDKDNWEWPRHNADFCLMRIYTGPDGTPA